MNDHARYKKHLRTQVVASIIINALINGLLAYFGNTGKDYMQLERTVTLRDLLIDLLITGMVLGSLNAWSAIAGMKKEQLTGVLSEGKSWDFGVKRPLLAGLMAGIGIGLIFWLGTALIFLLFSLERFTLTGYTQYKSALTGAMGGLIIGLFICFAAGHKTERNSA